MTLERNTIVVLDYNDNPKWYMSVTKIILGIMDEQVIAANTNPNITINRDEICDVVEVDNWIITSRPVKPNTILLQVSQNEKSQITLLNEQNLVNDKKCGKSSSKKQNLAEVTWISNKDSPHVLKVSERNIFPAYKNNVDRDAIQIQECNSNEVSACSSFYVVYCFLHYGV